ncbi:F0F1 ATP synthase subunit A [Candidatus Uhrbacteria bacterium]|nr:F0F1 ATP synthase subunit A [Candidatus Uhrbacteria bacterium]
MNIPAAAETIFTIGNFPVTNSLLNGWIATVLFVVFGYLVSRRVTAVPAGLQNSVEALLEFMLATVDQVTHDRARSKKFLPIVGTLFLFILVSNWMGSIPGTGTIGVWKTVHGELELVPIFRPATSDLNLTVAMAIFAVTASHVLGVFAIGLAKHAGKFFQLAGLLKAFKAFGHIKKPADAAQALLGVFIALVEMMVGLIELVSEAAKMVSLSLRLFGNIFAGEVLLTVLYSLIAFAVPLPFMFLELIVGVVQAMVFSMLTLVYLTIATEAPPGSEHAQEAHA